MIYLPFTLNESIALLFLTATAMVVLVLGDLSPEIVNLSRVVLIRLIP